MSAGLPLLLALLLLALLALGLLGLVALFCFGSGLFCLHLLAFGLDAEFFVDARLKEGTELLGIAADKGVLRDRHALVGEHGHKDALAVEHVVELFKREELRLAARAPNHQAVLVGGDAAIAATHGLVGLNGVDKVAGEGVVQVFAPPGQKGAEYDQDDAKLDPVAAGHQHADADERGNCRGDIQRAATPGRGDQAGEVGDEVVFVLVLVEVQDAVVGCGLLLERDLDLVDIEDIKEFSILKDAAATAVYGVRGANGVVLVTTRGGIVGKPQINIKFEAGMVQPTKIPDMIDAVQFAEMYNAAAGYDFYSKKDIQMFRDGSDPDLHPNIDWVDRLYKDYSFNQRVNVNISGGGSTAKYYISGGFYNEDGLFKADNMKEYNTSVFYRRFNFRSNVEVQLHKYTKLNVNLATTFERKNEPGSSATGANGIWGYALKTAANAFPDVYSNGYLAGPASGQGENPYALLTQTGYREIFYNTAQSLFVLTQDLGDWVTKGLTVSIKGSFDAKNENNLSRTKTSPQWLATGRNEAGELEFNQTKIGEENLTYKQTNKGYRSVYFEAVANWARTFGKHDLSAMFLFQQSQKNYVGESANNSEKALPYRHQGIAGRITYNYDNRYFVEGNFGYNGSENFSPNHRFGFFPSIAVGYVVSNEKFFAPIRDVVSMVKLKASYGLVGNDQIGGDRRFIYNETVIGGGKYYFGTTPSQYTSVRLGEFPNPNVGWEKAKKLNLGADLSFFNQLNISVDYFKENREGIFLQRKSIPMYVGLSTKPWVNIGKMRNSGIDASLEYHQPLGKDLHLTVRGNFTYARNRIMDQDEPDYAYTYMNHSGQMQWQKFGLVAAGLFQDQEDIDSWAKQSFGEVKPGDIKYLDLNGDGIVDNYDTKPIGYSDIPEIVYGFGFSLQWKAFDLSAFFQGVAHVSFSTLTDQTQAFVGRNLKESSVFADLYGNTWTPENPGAKYPRMTTGAIDNNNQLSTFWMANGRYLRLKNLELGYTLPKRIANKIAMQSLRVYLSGVNLFTFSPFKLWDPDLQTGATNYPNNRIINLGLTIGF